jgi:hypothetical protein
MTKRTKSKQAKALDNTGKGVARKIVEGRGMTQSGEMLAQDTFWKGPLRPCASGDELVALTLATVREHQVLCVQDPWTAGIHYIADRAAELEHRCRVVVEMENGDDSVCYLPGRLDTKHPDKAKALDVRIIGANGKDCGPCRRCEHQAVIRIVSECRAI